MNTSTAPLYYKFKVQKRWLTMPDGVRLAATFFVPKAKRTGEKFPVLFEYLPYRKDDSFYVMDFPSYSHFAKLGFITVKVDIRGTGGSFGHVPPREYSDVELDDAEEIIRQLAGLKNSNGNVGMWGVSWSGFNAIQVAMRQPPALKAILAMHASDDLFHDDVHYIDGSFHIDPYHLMINHETGLPRTPDYRLDESYFANRFDAEPWFLTYLREQRDGTFWREQSLRWNYDAVKIPVYMIGGLLDGYRDTILRMLENMNVPIKAEIGPYDHGCPDDAMPGPNYEWHHEAHRWWDHWLRGIDNGIADEVTPAKRLAVFVREGHPPDLQLETAPGHWRYEGWPVERTSWLDLFPSRGGRLVREPRKKNHTEELLKYIPSSGVQTGRWWGDQTGDVREDDAHSLVFNSRRLAEAVEIVGFPKVRLKVSADAPVANWVARLEDLHPDGRVTLVTGGLINASQREDRLNPTPLVPGEVYELSFDMHFTTWTFKAGHRIRLAVTNAQFPMVWPSSHPMTTTLHTACRGTSLSLPVIPEAERVTPAFTKPVDKDDCPDGEFLDDGEPEYIREHSRDPINGTATVVYGSRSCYEIRRRTYTVVERNTWKTCDERPWESSYLGERSTTIDSPRRNLKIAVTISVESTKDSFLVTVTRELHKNGKRVRRRTWKEKIQRRFH